MGITIDEILALEEFSDTVMISGFEGSRNEVELVNIMEVPDIIRYTHENALLFTTLYPIMNNENALKKFIPELSKNNLAGVAIKIGRYIDKLPDYMIKQSNDLCFPILLLPEDANFSDLTNKILAKLLGMKTSILEFREEITNRYQNLLLSGGDINRFIKITSDYLQSEIIILDDELELVRGSNDFIEESYLIWRESLDYNDLTTNLQNSHNFSNEIEKIYHKNADVYPVVSGDMFLGYMVILSQFQIKENEKHIVVIEQAIILLAFLFESQKNIEQTEINYLDSFIRDIINDHYINQDEIVEKAKVFNWNLKFPLLLLSIRIKNRKNIDDQTFYKSSDNSKFLKELMIKELGISKEDIKIIFFNGETLCFLNKNHDKLSKEFIYSALVRMIRKIDKNVLLQVSISSCINKISELKKEYNNLKLVHDIYDGHNHKNQYIIFYEDLGIYKFFHAISQKQIMLDFVNNTIGTILEEDLKKKSDLLYTLEILIKNNMAIKKTSEELFIHVNSLRYRMNQLDELGVDLDDGYLLSEISIAIQMNNYLKTISFK